MHINVEKIIALIRSVLRFAAPKKKEPIANRGKKVKIGSRDKGIGG